MVILGINAYHPDSAACILRDGHLIAAVEEERFTRIKHDCSLPLQSIRYCLREANVKPSEIAHIAVNRSPWANWWQKAQWAVQTGQWRQRAKNLIHIRQLRTDLERELDSPIYGHLHFIEHHRAHCASAFLCSPHASATIVSVDGSGDFSTVAWARGSGDRIVMQQRVHFPHSLGLLYLALTQALGFETYGDEYKLMGLAAYGKPIYLDHLRQLVTLKPNGSIQLDLRYFLHHEQAATMSWPGGTPVIGQLAHQRLHDLLPTGLKDPDLAASIQALYEECLDHVLVGTDRHALCLAGGCALNSVANGKLAHRFDSVYVPSVPHDAGGALGAALSVWCERLGHPRRFVLDRVGWGPSFDDTAIHHALTKKHDDLIGLLKSCYAHTDRRELFRATCRQLEMGKIVGWFQGKAEFGPRALGHRSILADPRRREMRTLLNLRIKHREEFRPFAPSVLEEKAQDWFELPHPSPFMSFTVPVKADKREKIPAVVHVDGSARPQTVSRRTNPLFWELLSMWEMHTGVPVLLNTSFNENEPIVNTPEDALECFIRTEMDALVIGSWILTKKE